MLIWAASATNVYGQVIRPFDVRASFDDRGDVEMIGNVLLTCDPVDFDCEDIQNGVISGNNNRTMTFVNIDLGAGFNNTSSADLSLPAGATVLYAGLYWGARAEPGDSDREIIQFRVPGSAFYDEITAEQFDTITLEGEADSRPYQAFAEVTELIQSAGNGTYFAGGLTAILDQDDLGFYGGWSLIVIYQDNAQPFRRLTLFDGAASISGSNSETISVSGLLTPLSGTFDTFLGALVWEGDEEFTGDQFVLNNEVLSDDLNPANNFWNSSITRLGTRIDAKNPDYVNQLAMDINYVDASGIFANGETDAEIEFITNGDVYFPHALVFAVDLYVPDVVSSIEKNAEDLNGGTLLPGDVIEYTISFTNEGEDGATNVAVTDPIPNGTSYIPGSLEIIENAGGPTGPQTDSPGDDLAEFDPIENEVVFRLGQGADASNGGLMAFGESVVIRFQVQVDDDNDLSGETISNTVRVTHNAETLEDLEFTGEDTAELVVDELADLSIEKTVDDPEPAVGSAVEFTIVVTNNGPADATGVEVIDQLPDGYTFVTATAAPGSYDETTGLWTIGNLGNGDTATLSVEAEVNSTGDYINTAMVSADQPDPDPDNNTDTSETDPESVIEAIDDNYGPVDGVSGDADVGNVLDNDTLNGDPVDPADITIEVVGSLPGGITLDTDTGIVGVEPGTSPGSYDFEYEICVIGQPDICDTATVTITVTPPAVDIQADLTIDECWRMLSSPINTTYEQLLDGLWTEGFPGSDDPGASLPNVYTWPADADGNDVGEWQPLGDLTDPIPAGSGFIISIIDQDGTGFPKTISASGDGFTPNVEPVLNSNDDGWSLVGNPFDVPVLFDDLVRNDLTDVAYVYDRNAGGTTGGNSGGWRTTDGTFGEIEDGIIAAFQGFFVQNDGGSPSLAFIEDSKTTGGQFYGKEGSQNQSFVRLELSGEDLVNSAWITFGEHGDSQRVRGDAWQLTPFSENYAMLAAVKTDQNLYDIAHFPAGKTTYEIPLYAGATLSGSYSLSATDLKLPSDFQAVFVDYELGKELPVDEFFAYEFTIDNQEAAKSNPFSSQQGPGCTQAGSTLSQNVYPSVAKASANGPRFAIRVIGTEANQEVPSEIALRQNYPNPFNPVTQITYQLPQAADVTLGVYDMLGRRIATLVDGAVQAGVHTASFDATNMSSGVYIYRLQTGSVVLSRKLTVIK